MLNYIKDWFNDFIRDERASKYEHKEEEKSTLRIIHDIIKLMEPLRPLDRYTGYDVHIYPALGHVTINVDSDADQTKLKDMNFKTIRKIRTFYGSSTYNVDVWEYRSKISPNYRQDYVAKYLIPIYEFLNETEDDYSYILDRFNLSCLTAYLTIVESRLNNDGEETEEVFDLAKDILDAFIGMVTERRKELDELRIKIKNGTNQSHKALLQQELEYVNKFIKGDTVNE